VDQCQQHGLAVKVTRKWNGASSFVAEGGIERNRRIKLLVNADSLQSHRQLRLRRRGGGQREECERRVSTAPRYVPIANARGSEAAPLHNPRCSAVFALSRDRKEAV